MKLRVLQFTSEFWLLRLWWSIYSCHAEASDSVSCIIKVCNVYKSGTLFSKIILLESSGLTGSLRWLCFRNAAWKELKSRDLDTSYCSLQNIFLFNAPCVSHDLLWDCKKCKPRSYCPTVQVYQKFTLFAEYSCNYSISFNFQTCSQYLNMYSN